MNLNHLPEKELDNESETGRQKIDAPNGVAWKETRRADEDRESPPSAANAQEDEQGAKGHREGRHTDRSVGVSFQWEAWPSIIGEAMPMLRLYWDTEGEIFGKELPMDPDLDYAMFLHRTGRLRIFTARRAGFLIGLNSFNVGTTMWRKRTMTAIALILYMLPSERRGLIGYRFLRDTDKGLADMGVRLVQHVPGSTVDISPLLLRLGYKRQQGTFERML